MSSGAKEICIGVLVVLLRIRLTLGARRRILLIPQVDTEFTIRAVSRALSGE